MFDSRIAKKNTYLAAVLAYLVPGAGHLYQGRVFKAIVYFCCIYGAFFYGMYLAEWKAVYNSQSPQNRTLGYFAQVGVGIPALYALVQSSRYNSRHNVPKNTLQAPLSAEFTGYAVDTSHPDEGRPISGTIELKPDFERRGIIGGTFTGTDADGKPFNIESLGGNTSYLAPKVGAGTGRDLHCGIVNQPGTETEGFDFIEGTIPRDFLDWFEAPLENADLQDLNGRLGKQYELALVYTWIAGLLNFLIVWDALEGPAYGYGDEEEEEDGDVDRADEQSEKSKKPLTAAS